MKRKKQAGAKHRRHNVAVLREILGLSQPKFMAIQPRFKLSTLCAVEAGKLPLSQAFAEVISGTTGIDPKWLVTGDPQQPVDVSGHPYTKESYDKWRSEKAKLAEIRPTEAGLPGDFEITMTFQELQQKLQAANQAGLQGRPMHAKAHLVVDLEEDGVSA